MKGLSLPFPTGACQGALAHGIPGNEQMANLLRLDFCQLILRIGGGDFHFVQSVDYTYLPLDNIQQPARHIDFRVHRNAHRPSIGVNIRSNNGRL